MPVRTRAGRTYDLTAPTVTARRRRRRAGMSADELAIVRRDETARVRAAQAGRSVGRRAAERSENTARTRAARARVSDERRAAERSENTARTRAARARMSDERRAAERSENTARTRASRTRMSEESRAAERNTNTARTRAARARMTDERRTVGRRENTERRRMARARSSDPQRQARASRQPWIHLPVHRIPNPAPITLGRSSVCGGCSAELLHGEDSSFCCRDGRIAVEPLPPLPPGWTEMFMDTNFRKASRKYNNLFAFTAMGVSGPEGFVPMAVPSCVKINGRTYHRVLPGNMRGTVRWYVHDPDERRSEAAGLSLNEGYVDNIRVTLNRINIYARELIALGQLPSEELALHLQWNEESSEIAAIIHHPEVGPAAHERTVVFWKRSMLQPTFIHPLHPLYEPLQYPLFFPHGTAGYHINLHSLNPPYSKVSQIEFYRQRILTDSRFGMLGRLLNEYLVDMFSSVEDSRLQYIRSEVQTRIAARRELDETIEAEGGRCAGRVYLPASFQGSPRMQRKLIADGLAIVRRYGKPTYFLTVTCNPNWEEIRNHPGMNGQNASDRPDVTCRVFHQKLKKILNTLRQGLLGNKIYLLHVVEFQKRGLPHAHLALRVEPQPLSTDQIDEVISAEVPPVSEHRDDRRYRELVQRHMIHHHTHACLDENRHCRKNFPKPLVERTYIDDRGYVHYRRRSPEDQWVVPHNRHLLLLLESHFNVEVSCTVNLIMYLYKYIFKGPDRARYTLNTEATDEIQEYIQARYLSASEAAWRIFGFHVNQREPSVSALPVHLPGEDSLLFSSENAERVLATTVSMLDRYLSRPADTMFDEVRYCDYFEQFMVSNALPRGATEHWRDQVPDHEMYVYRRLRGEKICRMNMLYPSVGEKFYLKLLLLHTAPRSFLLARTVDGTVHESFQAATRALGLLDDNTEGELCFNEAVESGFSPQQLRCLLVTLAMDGAPARNLLEGNQNILMADFSELASTPIASVWNRCLQDLSDRLETLGRSMSDFGLPEPVRELTEVDRELLRWDRESCQQFVDAHLSLLSSDEQRVIFDEVVNAVRNERPLLMYVDGRSGRGKTLLMKVITAAVRAQGKIVLCTATTGLAALNHEGGTTAHSMYKIPVTDEDEAPQCNVTAGSQRGELLQMAAVHIWDEFPMCHRRVFEAVNRCLCDLMQTTIACGGRVFVCCGDFRQIPPVIPGGGRHAIIEATIKSSPLWPMFEVRELTHPQRDAGDTRYSNFVDSIGDGDLPETYSTATTTGLVNLEVMAVTTDEDAAINFVFPNINDVQECSQRAIITGTNRVVDALNSKILVRLQGEVVPLFSVTRLCSDETRLTNLLSTEFLNSLRSPGVPDHELKLKLNCLCMVTRNISVRDRLMNNTKVIVREIGRHLITVETLMGHRQFVLPRIVFRFTLPRSGLIIERRQFPLRLCYAITVNKSQGQTLDKVCVDLREHPFAHGQLYVAASRVRNSDNILILTQDSLLRDGCALTKNIVYQELLP